MSARNSPSTRSAVRQVRMRTSGAKLERRPDGTLLVTPDEQLREYPKVLTDRVAHWAREFPDRVCIAKRDANGEWRRLTYAEIWESIRSVGQALLGFGLSAERPVMILSENDLEQFILTLAGQHVGIPVAPISPPYSLVSKDLSRLRHIAKLLTPGLIFAADGNRYERALAAIATETTPIVVTHSPPRGKPAISFSDLLNTIPSQSVDAAHDRIHPDDVAKFLFTSGSTAMPKGVINTHRMICSNLANDQSGFRFSGRRAAGPGRLASVESHLRRQSQHRNFSLQRRHLLHRRRPPRPGFLPRNPAQSTRNLHHRLLQRPQSLRRPAPSTAQRSRPTRNFLPPPETSYSMPPPASRNQCGMPIAHSPKNPAANASSWSPASAPRKPPPWPFKPVGKPITPA